VELALRVFLYAARDADAARLREALQASRHVDAVPENVVTLDDDVADIDTDADLHTWSCRRRDIAFRHAALDLDGTAHGLDHARELDQHPLSCGLYKPHTVFA